MELVRGATLEQQLRTSGPLGAREAALVGIDLCRALAAIHAAGLIHRDVKAQNVMREDGGRIVLMDLGTGREVGTPSEAVAPDLAGTPLYLAPEMFSGARGERANRSLQSRRASLSPGHRHLSRSARRPFRNCTKGTPRAASSGCATRAPTCPRRSSASSSARSPAMRGCGMRPPASSKPTSPTPSKDLPCQAPLARRRADGEWFRGCHPDS